MSNSSIKIDEDCLANSVTNAFYLTDIRGLRWKKYTSPCTNSSNTSNDPILAAYSNAIRADVLSVWRRVPIPNVPIEELGTRLFDCPKELYMFWFGEEPTINGFPSSNLQEAENGYFENGINAFTLDLFFKSIHSIIERSLLNSEFIRLGEWFTKPVEDDANNNSPNTMVAFKFSLFIHGKTSVVATVKMEEKMSVRTLSHTDLAKSSKVVLAPYGLNAQLTGQHLPDSDTQSIKLLDEWKKFFALGNIKHDKCPAVVEVVFGEVKMLYPSSLVLVPSSSKTENLCSVPNSKVKPPKHNDAVKHCWECVKENEPCSAPTTQLWDMKGNLHQTGCSCSSNSNTTRIKSSTNPFASSNILHGNLKSLSQNINAKSKKESTSMSPFHLRPAKPDKPKGRLTPSLVTGRSTPLLNNNNQQSKVVPDEKPTIVESMKRKTPSPTDMKTPSTVSDIVTPNLTMSPIVSTAGETKVMPTLMETSVKVKTETADVKKQPDMLALPCLPEESLDPRLGEDLTMEIVKILAKTDVKALASSNENIKRSIDLVSPVEEKEPIKKIKQEPQEVQPKRVGRQRGRRKSTVQNLQPISIIDLEEDVVSPTASSRRTSSRHSASENCIVNPAAVTESPHPTGPGRPSKRRTSSRSVGTPKNENQAFNFSGTKQSVPFPSPPPHFSPSVRTSLTSIKDLVPITADLDNLFDDEDDIGALKKSSSLNSNDTVQITAPVVVNMPPPSTISQQDLQKMFPTPPSPPNAMSPVTSVHSDINVSSSTPGACMEVLSPEMQHAITVSETDHLEINLEARSPNSVSVNPMLISLDLNLICEDGYTRCQTLV